MVRRPAPALLTAAVCVAFAVVVWALAFHTHVGRAADASALRGFMTLHGWHLTGAAQQLAQLCSPLPYAVLSAVVLVWTYRTGGPRAVVAAAVILVSANVLTQVLKELLATPRPNGGAYVAAASWPSGHSTAAMALALCATIAARPAARLATAIIGGLFAVGVADSVVLLGWHYPSDALGGFAVAGAVTGVVVAASAWVQARWAAGTGRRALHDRSLSAWWPGAAAGIGVAAVVIAFAFEYISSVAGRRDDGAAFVLFAAAIAAVGLALAVVCSSTQAES